MLLLHEVDARIYDVDIPEQGVTSRTAPRCRSCRSWCVWPELVDERLTSAPSLAQGRSPPFQPTRTF